MPDDGLADGRGAKQREHKAGVRDGVPGDGERVGTQQGGKRRAAARASTSDSCFVRQAESAVARTAAAGPRLYADECCAYLAHGQQR